MVIVVIAIASCGVCFYGFLVACAALYADVSAAEADLYSGPDFSPERVPNEIRASARAEINSVGL